MTKTPVESAREFLSSGMTENYNAENIQARKLMEDLSEYAESLERKVEISDAAEYVDALDHIMRVANASRTQTRRYRWIAERARCALEGGDWREMDLPKMAKNAGE